MLWFGPMVLGPVILTLWVILGSWLPSNIICAPPPGIANVIVFTSAAKFAALIASRKLQLPGTQSTLVSAVFVTTSDAGGASSFRIVPTPWLLAIVAFIGLVRLTKNVSSASYVVSPLTVTNTFGDTTRRGALVLPALIVRVVSGIAT